MKKRILYLHVKRKYFDQIKSGEKTEEYRLFNSYWCARLDFKTFDEVHILNGYPKKHDLTRRIIFPWNGYKIKQITHKEFGGGSVDVYAVRLSNKPFHADPNSRAGEL